MSEEFKQLSRSTPHNTFRADLLAKDMSYQEKVFCSAYCGDGVIAARVAGYIGTREELEKIANTLLRKPEVKELIKYQGQVSEHVDAAIMSKRERQTFLSSLVRNVDPYTDPNDVKDEFGNNTKQHIRMTDRLKALELLGKSSGDYVTKVDVSHNHSINDLVLKSYEVEDDIKDIEAEWKKVQEKKLEAKNKERTSESLFEQKYPTPQVVEEDEDFGGLL